MNDKSSLIIGVHNSISNIFDAAKLVKTSNELAGGQGGGGKSELAQAGGFDFEKQKEIISYISSAIIEKEIS